NLTGAATFEIVDIPPAFLAFGVHDHSRMELPQMRLALEHTEKPREVVKVIGRTQFFVTRACLDQSEKRCSVEWFLRSVGHAQTKGAVRNPCCERIRHGSTWP